MRYLIIDTFNGQGYSESGIIQDLKYTDMDEQTAKYNALEVARKEFGERYLPTNPSYSVKVTYQSDALCGNDGEDDGAIHFKRVNDEDYGLYINPQINEATLIKKESFLNLINQLSQDGELQHNLEADDITWAEWLDDLYTEGYNDGHASEEYFILYKL